MSLHFTPNVHHRTSQHTQPDTMSPLKPLLLAGGRSSRMGQRKELLRLPNGKPMYMHLLSVLHAACPDAEAVYLSQRDHKAAQELNRQCGALHGPNENELGLSNSDGSTTPVRVVYDREDEPGDDIGPGAGLLAAYRADPTATWLVAACDYPLLSAEALLQLQEEMIGSLVTCFCNEDGFCEPLLAIWTPGALQTLKDNVQKDILGPKAVVRHCQGRMVRAREGRWLVNANTPEEWDQALALWKCVEEA